MWFFKVIAKKNKFLQKTGGEGERAPPALFSKYASRYEITPPDLDINKFDTKKP